MATAITNTLINKYNTATEYKAATAATETTADKAEEFKYTPTGKANKVVFGIAVANSHGSVAVKFAKAPGVFGGADLTISAPENKTTVVQVEQGRFVQADGTFKITMTPATGKKLYTDHAATIYAIETM